MAESQSENSVTNESREHSDRTFGSYPLLLQTFIRRSLSRREVFSDTGKGGMPDQFLIRSKTYQFLSCSHRTRRSRYGNATQSSWASLFHRGNAGCSRRAIFFGVMPNR